MAPDRLVAALDEAAKRGKLPEFEPAGRTRQAGTGAPTDGLDGRDGLDGPDGPGSGGPGASAASHAAAALFTMLAYGTPWDADLIGELEPPASAPTPRVPVTDAPSGVPAAAPPAAAAGATTVRFRLQFRRRQPVIFAIVLILTVEPGRYFTDELLANLIPALHGHIPTWWWWYPLTIIPIPWLWRGWLRKSRKTTADNARERIGQMAEILGGEVVG